MTSKKPRASEPRTKRTVPDAGAALILLIVLGAIPAGVVAAPQDALDKPSLLQIPVDAMAPAAIALLNGPVECVEPEEIYTGLESSTAECGLPGAECLLEGELYRCVVDCWVWRSTSGPSCVSDFGRDVVFASVGVYYCPPRGVNVACDANSEPTDGFVYARGLRSYADVEDACGDGHDIGWSWAPRFDEGVFEDSNSGVQYFCPRARTAITYHNDAAKGAAGAFFEFYAQRP